TGNSLLVSTKVKKITLLSLIFLFPCSLQKMARTLLQLSPAKNLPKISGPSGVLKPSSMKYCLSIPSCFILSQWYAIQALPFHSCPKQCAKYHRYKLPVSYSHQQFHPA